MDFQLSQRHHMLSHQRPQTSFKPKQLSQCRSGQPRTVWDLVRLWHYRFELTFGLYVMDTGEKTVFYAVIMLLLAAVVWAITWTSSLMLSGIEAAVGTRWRQLAGKAVATQVQAWAELKMDNDMGSRLGSVARNGTRRTL
ncbi:uncharacterized protein PV09_05361 [Verruconis gallopava]|uniref:Uncharacterized protein n=1 Tax=Verruconis gallopava TaxID=253628 RepID=A0A0D2AA36_9PEZI|nr:uncharacterized protein PV09_05361 [Verruconis gallopava]KIW03608.1 hypothetical protein PV09_05361 [Verruconis gallopava]